MNLADGFERPNRGYRDEPATIPCGLLAQPQPKGRKDAPCPEAFFCEEGRDLHLRDTHHIGLALVEAPAPGPRRGEEDGTRAGVGSGPASAASTPERLRRYDRVYPPMAEATDDPRYVWRANIVSGRMQRVRVS